MPLQSADFLEAAFAEPALVASLRLPLQVAKTAGDRTVTEDRTKEPPRHQFGGAGTLFQMLSMRLTAVRLNSGELFRADGVLATTRR